MLKRRSKREANAAALRRAEGPAAFIEFEVEDPAALDQEWNYTDRAERLNRAGHRLLSRGFFPEAAKVFERATRHDRSHAGAAVGSIETLIILGRIAQAADVAHEAIERYGRNCDIGAARAHLFLHEDRVEEAIRYMDIASEHSPDSAYVWLIAGELRVALGRGLEGSEDCFNRARHAPIPWPHLDVRVALAFMEWNEFEPAERILEGVVRRTPRLPLAWLVLGDLHRVRNRPRRARRCYKRLLELVPKLEPARKALSLKTQITMNVQSIRARLGRRFGRR